MSPKRYVGQFSHDWACMNCFACSSVQTTPGPHSGLCPSSLNIFQLKFSMILKMSQHARSSWAINSDDLNLTTNPVDISRLISQAGIRPPSSLSSVPWQLSSPRGLSHHWAKRYGGSDIGPSFSVSQSHPKDLKMEIYLNEYRPRLCVSLCWQFAPNVFRAC